MIEAISAGRTDRIWDWLAAGHAATARDTQGNELIVCCAYYGDVSAIRHLLAHGASLATLGDNFDLNGAAFHGHWQLCQFLIEQGADVRHILPASQETVLHAALASPRKDAHENVLRVLLAAGADVHARTAAGAETGCFMRDTRTRGETALHRAAALSSETCIALLLAAGAQVEARDLHGDTPLAWASWAQRPDAILRLLCFGEHRIHPQRQPLTMSLSGRPEA